MDYIVQEQIRRISKTAQDKNLGLVRGSKTFLKRLRYGNPYLAKIMVLSILQLILVLRIDLKFLLHLSSLYSPLCFQTPLLHCANVTFLLVQSHAFLFVGTISLYLLVAPTLRPAQKSFCLLCPRSLPH